MAQKKRTPVKKLSFGDAVSEVEEILEKLESEDIDIDDLSGEVARAVELIKVCRTKLEKTDLEVRALVAELDGDEAAAAVAAADETAAGGDKTDADDVIPF